jgi:hypothetical protein
LASLRRGEAHLNLFRLEVQVRKFRIPRTRARRVAFRIICRRVSGLFVVESLHAGAERGVRNRSGSCDVALQADPAISGTEAKPPACRLRCQDLFLDCPAMGKPVSKTRTCGARAQVTRGSRIEAPDGWSRPRSRPR